MVKDLSSFFSPNSIAIIGASRKQEKVGAMILKNIIDSKFKGEVFPVNPHADSIQGITTYPNVESLPKTPDLAIMAIPAEETLKVLEECARKKIKNIVVVSAGFKETGEPGEKLENQLVEIAEKFKLNILGPNCLGFIDNNIALNASFAPTEKKLGNLSFISQSGAIASSIFDWFKSSEIGFSEFITIGNKAVLNENDVLNYLKSEKKDINFEPGLSKVSPIGLYLEGIEDGLEFLKIAKEITKRNPIFILKPGKTKEAQKAIQSHTGAIVGEDSVMDEAFKEAGIIRANTLEEFFGLSKALSWENVPEGPKVAIISNAGGPAVITSDAIAGKGLKLAQMNQETREKLEEILPRYSSVINPIDVLGDALADRIYKAAQIVLESNQADSLLIILTPQSMTQPEKTAQLLGELSKKYQKPIFCSFIGGSLVSEGVKKLNELKIPSFDYPEQAITIISKMYQWRLYKDQEIDAQDMKKVELANLTEAKRIISDSISKGDLSLSAVDANLLLRSLGFSTPQTIEISNYDSLLDFAKNIGWPVVLKISSPDLVHKSEVGGVITEISNEEDLEKAFNKLKQIIEELNPENAKILLQKDIVNGVEVIVGVKTDPTFGKVLLFGAGGTLTELIVDRNLKLLPIGFTQAKRLVEKSKIYTLLRGFRGGSSFALEKLYELIVKVSKLSLAFPQVSEIEINPVLVTLNDAFALDGKFIFSKEEKKVTGPKFHRADVIEHTILATNYHFFILKSECPLQYIPGQYISVKVADSRLNSYSIAGNDGVNFSVLVDVSPGGPGSNYFKNLKKGDKISYLGPFGIFTLKPEEEKRTILFLGTGSGCSPLKCILESALTEKKYKNEIILYFGLRYQNDIFWQEHFRELAKKYPNFKFKLVLSRPNETWQGQIGHITDYLKKDFPDATNCTAYICGNKQMLDDATDILISKGCPKEKIYSEKF
ncbi:MAG: hypothetical protein A2152_03895 [Candidatus Levybacteria bacterium RBG_16_35_6]|nr:MAG: hypothetical protein A2152_03895 [Candidatus Levybacteria bacterium RBG_16_35_6]